MANSYYNPSGVPGTGSPGQSAPVRGEYDNIAAGFAFLPTLGAGVANQIVVVNSGGTALATVVASTIAITSFSAGTTGFTPNSPTTSAIVLDGTLVVGNGGTGVTSLTTNGVLYGGATVGVTAAGGVGQLFVGSAGAPGWLAAGTPGQILVGETSASPSWLAAGSANQVLQSNGATDPSWVGTVQTFSGGTTGLTPSSASINNIVLAGTLNVANGGTGLTTAPTNGQILIGSTGAGYAVAALTAGANITITNGAGTISIVGAGSVSSVGLALPGIFTVSGSPVTGTGTLTAVLATQTANTVFAGPTTGSAATPIFRSTVIGDLPTSGYVLGTSTATTQSVGDSSTKVATTAFVQAAVVGSASATTFLGSNVLLNNSSNFFDGPNTGSIGAAGQTWEITINAAMIDSSGGPGAALEAAIFNGTSYLGAVSINTPASGYVVSISTSIVVTLAAATTFTLRAKDASTTSGTLLTTTGTAVANKSTSITAVRLA